MCSCREKWSARYSAHWRLPCDLIRKSQLSRLRSDVIFGCSTCPRMDFVATRRHTRHGVRRRYITSHPTCAHSESIQLSSRSTSFCPYSRSSNIQHTATLAFFCLTLMLLHPLFSLSVVPHHSSTSGLRHHPFHSTTECSFRRDRVLN